VKGRNREVGEAGEEESKNLEIAQPKGGRRKKRWDESRCHQ